VLTLSLLLFSIASASPVQADADARDMERLRTLQKHIKIIRDNLQKARQQHGRLQTELQTLDLSVNRINRKLRQLRKRQTSTEQNLRESLRQQKQLKRQVDKARQLLASQVRASYIMGRQEQLKIVLNQGSPSTVQRALIYYDYLNRSRVNQINDINDQLVRLERLEAQIHDEQTTLKQLADEQTQQKDDLLQTRQSRRQLMSKLAREIDTDDKRLARLLENEKELQQVLKAVESLGDITHQALEDKPFAARKGKLPWPASGRIRKSFGKPRAAGGLTWSGVVIDARSGANIKAIARGRVAFTDWLRGYGLLLIVDHGDGFMSLYGHNQSVFKEIGEWVEAGEVVATVGRSGGQSDHQLYFELRRNGKPVNPAVWCRRTQGGLISLK
jgi:septal ring factor EnvC (AmiA/AmiB activator)